MTLLSFLYPFFLIPSLPPFPFPPFRPTLSSSLRRINSPLADHSHSHPFSRLFFHLYFIFTGHHFFRHTLTPSSSSPLLRQTNFTPSPTPTTKMMNSGNSLLLRLFKSEFFNAWIAVSYLFKYPDAVGIQHYLCNELKKFPLDEIEFFLPQLV